MVHITTQENLESPELSHVGDHDCTLQPTNAPTVPSR